LRNKRGGETRIRWFLESKNLRKRKKPATTPLTENHTRKGKKRCETFEGTGREWGGLGDGGALRKRGRKSIKRIGVTGGQQGGSKNGQIP